MGTETRWRAEKRELDEVLGSAAWMSLRYVDDSGATCAYKVKQLIN